MSGHSKWAKIRHKKGANDAKKGKIFSKYAQQITIAARDGGGDLDANFSLRLLVDKAKAVSMPADNIKRAIDRGTGEGGETLQLENAMYEGFGPDGVSVIVETVTDNTNRTVSELRKVFSSKGGNLGDSGSVSWNFTNKGLVVMRPAHFEKQEKYGADDIIVQSDPEEVMLELMEIDGIQDIEEYDVTDGETAEENGKYFEVYTENKALTRVRDDINSKGFIIKSAELIWQSNDKKETSDETLEKVRGFIEDLEDVDDVQSVWTDVDQALG